MRYIVLYTRYYWVYWKLSKEMFVTMFGSAELIPGAGGDTWSNCKILHAYGGVANTGCCYFRFVN